MASDQLARLEKRLKRMPKAVRDSIQTALQVAGRDLVEEMKVLAEPSRDTGAMIDSITMTTAGNITPAYSQPGGSQVVPENTVTITAGNSRVRYAHFVEYGTSKMAAEPFFWPAYRLLQKALSDRIKLAASISIRDTWTK
jgi:HK97 gp10 family phage protein